MFSSMNMKNLTADKAQLDNQAASMGGRQEGAPPLFLAALNCLLRPACPEKE